MAADKLCVNIFEMVASIARVIDMMSPVIGNHHMQVAYLAYRLGEELQLSDDQKYELFIAGALHDIGAFSLQDRLDLLEFEDTKPGEHSMAGSLILETFPPFSGIARLIKFHHVHWKNGEGAFQNGESVPSESHIEMLRVAGSWGALHQERLNGTGYPFGLTSDELPLGARIMAVADVFTALTEDRPYRKGMDSKNTKTVLQTMVDAGELDNNLVDMIFKYYAKMNDMRDLAQKESIRDYNAFQTVLHRHLK